MEKINIKKEFILWPILIVPLIYIAYVWGQLPDTIAIHFNIHGDPNGWGSKWTIFLLPLVNIGGYILMLFLPAIDPKRMDNADFHSMFYNIRVIIVVFMSALGILTTQAAINGNLHNGLSRFVPELVFLLLAVLGNAMINIKPNWFVGIRTPWTLSSDTVWRKTHQVVGRIWFYGGLLCAILVYFSPHAWTGRLVTIFVIGTALFAFIYSYWLYKKEQEAKA